jgi:glycosyltransferase involved in cell wall biosynthesis
VRIALFTNNYLPFTGGVTISVETLRRGLEARGHEAWVFAPRFRGAPPDGARVVRYPSIPAATYPAFSLAIPFSRQIARQVRQLDFDVFHAHHPFLLGPTALRLARRQRRPLVFTYHTRYEKYAHYVPLTQALVETAAVRLSSSFAARTDAVIAPSSVIRDQLRHRGVGTPIAVVPTGVDLARFAPGDRDVMRRTLGLPPEDVIVLYVGRLDREKSVERILAAFDRIAGTVPKARLVLVGHGTEAERLMHLAGAMRVRERIHFFGVFPHDAIAACYQAADVFLFASETETQGLVLAEAAACGVPAVTVAAPGCDEVVRDGASGLLTKNDAAALADAVIGLLLDGPRRLAMGARARQIAEAEFGVEMQLDRTLALYRDALQRCGRGDA